MKMTELEDIYKSFMGDQPRKPIRYPKTDKPKKNKNDDFKWKKASKTILLWTIFIVFSIFLSQLFKSNREKEQVITFTQYQEFMKNDNISKLLVIGNEIHGDLKTQVTTTVGGVPKTFTKFKFTVPFVDREMLAEWDKQNILYDFKEKDIDWFGYLLNMLPWILLIVFWIFLIRRMQGGGGGSRGIFSFGKSRAKLLMENKPKITFEDVAGAEEAKMELVEIIGFLKDPKKFQKLGGKIPKGALLLGAPGTGKTLLARAVAGEAGVPFFSMSGADFVEMFVGVGAARVRDLFEQGKKNAPCIIFIDEIDAVGRQRGAGLGGGHDEREQTLNQLLVEMDGFEHNEGVIILAATNRPDVLDHALLRPGRFDRQIIVDRPDVKGREGILRVHLKKVPLAEDVDISVIAKSTPGFAGAELANLVNEAALLAARKDKLKVEMEDMEEAKDKVMMGVERKSLIINEEEKKSTAYHEAGHVLVAKLIPESDPIHKVTIIPRGRALGVTHSLPIDERHTYSKKYLNAILAKALGGRAAEKLVFKELTTGAGNDLEQATNLARKMVCDWGMSEKLGPLSFGKNDEVFIGRDFQTQKNYSEQTAVTIDQEIKNFVTEAETKAEKILGENIKKLHALAEALLEKEILDSSEIDDVLDGKYKPGLKKKKESKEQEPDPGEKEGSEKDLGTSIDKTV